jgi:hypothetical protein
VTRFTQLADESDEVPALHKKRYSNFHLSKVEWDHLKLVHEVLQVRRDVDFFLKKKTCLVLPQEPATAQQSFSKSQEPTVWRTIPILEFLQQSWENMANSSKFVDVRDAIRTGLENLAKWYYKTDDTDVYFICLGELSSTALIQSNLFVISP